MFNKTNNKIYNLILKFYQYSKIIKIMFITLKSYNLLYKKIQISLIIYKIKFNLYNKIIKIMFITLKSYNLLMNKKTINNSIYNLSRTRVHSEILIIYHLIIYKKIINLLMNLN